MPSFFLMIRPPPRSTLFPSTTLFRSGACGVRRLVDVSARDGWHKLRTLVVQPGDRKSTRLNSSHGYISYALFFFNDTAPTEIYPLSLHDALPIWSLRGPPVGGRERPGRMAQAAHPRGAAGRSEEHTSELQSRLHLVCPLFF